MDWHRDLCDDLEDFRLERSIRSVKTQEEIEKLCVDEKLSPVGRALYLLKNGQDVQKVNAVSMLPTLMRQDEFETQKKVLPKLCDILETSPAEIHYSAAFAFTTIVGENLMAPHLFAKQCLATVLSGLDNKDTSISKEWLKTLLVAIGYFPKDIIKRDMLGLALAKGQLSQSVSSRLASCEILGKMSTKFDSFWIKKEIFGFATSLCQDVDYDVRSCMCRQLKYIALGMGGDLTAALVLPEIIELTKDEESSVRISSIETLTEILDILSESAKKDTVIPLIQQFIQSSMAAKDGVLPVICQLYGRLCHVLKGLLKKEQRDFFIDIYRKLSCWHGGVAEGGHPSPSISTKSASQPSSLSNVADDDASVECRRLCAYNFPAMVLFVESQNFTKELSTSFHNFCTDKHPQIRRSIALGFHEVAKALGPSLVISIKKELLTLLKDSSSEVLQGLVGHVEVSLKLFAQHVAMGSMGLNKMQGLPEFIPALLSLDGTATKFRLWRLHEQILRQFSCLPECLTSDQIYFKFVPRLFKILASKFVLPVKIAACRTLCTFIRHNRKLEQRQELCHRLIEELGASKCYRNRLLFIDLCNVVMDIFSNNFFKETFFEYVLVLAKDPVANVKLKLCRALPKLKRVLKLPTDRLLLQQLETVIRHLLASEKDKDVAIGIRQAIVELDGIEIPMQTINRKTFFEDDMIDLKKEEEERLMVIMEEEEQAVEAAEAAKAGKQQQDSSKKKKPSRSLKTSPAASHSTQPGMKKSQTPPVLHKSTTFPSSTFPLGRNADVKKRLKDTSSSAGSSSVSSSKKAVSSPLSPGAASSPAPSLHHLKTSTHRPSSSSPRIQHLKSNTIDRGSVAPRKTVKHNS